VASHEPRGQHQQQQHEPGDQLQEQCLSTLRLQASASFAVLDSEHVLVVHLIHMLKEDERQHGVRPNASVVWSKAFP